MEFTYLIFILFGAFTTHNIEKSTIYKQCWTYENKLDAERCSDKILNEQKKFEFLK